MENTIKYKKLCKGSLTDKDWIELITLEYVMTWGYSSDRCEDLKRIAELRDKM